MPVDWPVARDLMTPQPITLAPDAPLSRAIGLMRSRRIHEIPVIRGSRVAGMITFESIARRSNLPFSTKVEHLLVLPPLLTPTTPYPEIAEQLLAAGLRAAPVMGKRGELVGVVSRTDLVRVFPDLGIAPRARVEEVASPPGVLVRENETCGRLFAQIRLLEEHPLPVVDRKGRLVGAVGVADLGRVLWRPITSGKRDAQRKDRTNAYSVEVGTIMHSPPVTVDAGTSPDDAARRMTHERVSSVFVVEDGRPTGVVAQGDLLGLAVGQATVPGRAVGDVYVQVHGLRGSGSPEILSEIDRVLARGLRRISRHARPLLLTLNVTPQGTHRSDDAQVQARLNTDRGSFYASRSGWNFFAGIADLMDELEVQTRRARELRSPRGRTSRRAVPAEGDLSVDPELDARIRTATRGRE